MPVLQIDIDWRGQALTLHDRPPPVGGLRFRLAFPPSMTVTGASPMAFTLTSSQKCTVSVAAVDAKGNPAQIDGAPVWTIESGADKLTLVPAADGLSAEVLAAGPVGDAQVKVTADADLGEGVTPLTGLLDVTVIAGAAVALALTPSAPVEQ